MNTSQSGFLYTLQIPLEHSKKLFCLVAVYHALALLVLLLIELSVPAWPFIIFVIASFYHHYRIYRHNIFPLNAKELRLNAENEWLLLTHDGEEYEARLLPGSFVHPKMLLLTIKCADKSLKICLLADNAHVDVLRRLRVRLRFPNVGQSHNYSKPNRL